MPKLHIYKSEKETCYAFAEWLAEVVKETLEKQNKFTISLPGGDLPKLLFKILATDYVNKLDWSKIHVFLGDERLVSFSDENNSPASSLEMLCNEIPVPKEQLHVIQTNIAPQESSKQYEALLHSYFEDNQKSFDLVILGMGEQGNVLSILPFTEDNSHKDEWVMPVYDKQEDIFKVTLTIAAINAASVKVFFVTGKKKEEVVQRVLKGKYDPEKYPAQLIITTNTPVHWFLDEGAAARLVKPIF